MIGYVRKGNKNEKSDRKEEDLGSLFDGCSCGLGNRVDYWDS